MAESSESASYATLLTDVRLLVVLWISVVGTMGPNVASPALPAMSGPLGVGDGRIGLVMTAYTLPAMVFVPLTGAMADMYGRRTVIIPSLVAFGVGGVAIGFAEVIAAPIPLSPFETVLGLRGLQGAGVAGFMSLTVTLLGDLYTGATGTTAQGLRVGWNGLGGIVVPVIAGALAGIGWYAPFFLYGLALLIAAVAFFLLPETVSGIEDGSGVRETLVLYAHSLRAELDDLRLVVLVSGGFARDFVRYAVITFVPLFAVRVLGASFAEAGTILGLRGVASIVISPVAGSITGRFDHRLALLLSLVLSGASIALLPGVSSLLALGALMVVYSVGDAIFSPDIKDAVTGATEDQYRSGVIGGMQLLKYGAQTASPAFFGVVLALAGFSELFTVAAGVSGAYALAVFALLGGGTVAPND
ncbi:MAG: MFS transporter [Haloferacaceae archaeon]